MKLRDFTLFLLIFAQAPLGSIASIKNGGLSPELPQKGEPVPFAGFIHCVQPGENVDKICRMYCVEKNDLVNLNNLNDSRPARPGMSLKIPAGKEGLD